MMVKNVENSPCTDYQSKVWERTNVNCDLLKYFGTLCLENERVYQK